MRKEYGKRVHIRKLGHYLLARFNPLHRAHDDLVVEYFPGHIWSCSVIDDVNHRQKYGAATDHEGPCKFPDSDGPVLCFIAAYIAGASGGVFPEP